MLPQESSLAYSGLVRERISRCVVGSLLQPSNSVGLRIWSSLTTKTWFHARRIHRKGRGKKPISGELVGKDCHDLLATGLSRLTHGLVILLACLQLVRMGEGGISLNSKVREPLKMTLMLAGTITTSRAGVKHFWRR